MNAQGKKIQIKINNSTKKTNQDIGDKSAYDYLYLVVTRNSLMFNADYASAFLLFYVLSSEDIPGDKYIAKNFIKGLTPIIAVDSQFKII